MRADSARNRGLHQSVAKGWLPNIGDNRRVGIKDDSDLYPENGIPNLVLSGRSK